MRPGAVEEGDGPALASGVRHGEAWRRLCVSAQEKLGLALTNSRESITILRKRKQQVWRSSECWAIGGLWLA